ncbi:hypothetical protein [Brevundimonas sp.]|uniref:hypothetical protein n=1 Tax=Brevundimonas sp. TaxID=1871086 RepID=UPI0027378EA4|nr:hypothetical protein [Brevundimonas sp.]MDP3801229.1 hypothetical protein [Brevundimonas sp.]MDZ4367473.1 hypothetical protein [Afipia sp.]
MSSLIGSNQSAPPHTAALAIQLNRNFVVQAAGIGMVKLMGLTTLPWPVVLIWTAGESNPQSAVA